MAKKGPAGPPRALLQPMQSGAPIEQVAFDVLGTFPIRDAGNHFIIVAMDYLTKWLRHLLSLTKVPSPLQRDSLRTSSAGSEFRRPSTVTKGRTFKSKVMAEVCRLLGWDHSSTTTRGRLGGAF